MEILFNFALTYIYTPEMKNSARHLIAAAMLLGIGGGSASAQYYAIADRMVDMITPALFGGFNYHGIVEVSAIKGVGENNADFVGISTSQGVNYADWFFLGVGIGVDALFTHVDSYYNSRGGESVTKSGCVVPLFTDLRFNLGTGSRVSYYLGAKIGCSFLMGNNDIHVNQGYITSDECFYLKPSLGVRIPTGTSGRNAFTISASYQLITPGYNRFDYDGERSISLNGFGVTLGYEW
jgi:hypothetical protein